MTENTESLHICILSKMFPPGVGGAETYAYELANGLGKRGHSVDVFTQWVDDPDETVDVHENVTVHRIAKARKMFVTFETLYFSFKAWRTIDFERYDIVHGTLMPASTIALGPEGTGENTPLVLTSHGTSIGEVHSVALETPADYLLKFFFHPMNVVMDWIAGQGADEIVAISDHARDELVQTYRFDDEHIQMIPHGVDTERFYPREEQHPAVDPDATTLLYVGRLGARKGLGLAFQALARLNDPNIEFLIAGTGRHEERLRTLAAKLGVADQIRFLGYVSDEELPVLYSSADVFVLPSRYEGFGLVLLEAMACGTPVIGTDVGGIPTVIEHDRTGLQVQREPQELANAIQSVVSDRSHQEEMAEAAYRKAVDTSWRAVVTDLETVYSRKMSPS